MDFCCWLQSNLTTSRIFFEWNIWNLKAALLQRRIIFQSSIRLSGFMICDLPLCFLSAMVIKEVKKGVKRIRDALQIHFFDSNSLILPPPLFQVSLGLIPYCWQVASRRLLVKETSVEAHSFGTCVLLEFHRYKYTSLRQASGQVSPMGISLNSFKSEL